ncbi:hypothetical protein ACFV0O_35620 [Kitasatospora sp. NPDC059577]|uniref:hypothetical protein n=1 Tax=Kitasatospora sp. NPDC059577 TaxID=3346873 RepID=UPI003693C731
MVLAGVGGSTFATWREQYVAGKELERRIAGEKWEQEKRWREEEDREAVQTAVAANTVGLAEHNSAMVIAAGVSYLTLVSHEDTWAFIARQAFGVWSPDWRSSDYSGDGWSGPNASVPATRRRRYARESPSKAPRVVDGHRNTSPGRHCRRDRRPGPVNTLEIARQLLALEPPVPSRRTGRDGRNCPHSCPDRPGRADLAPAQQPGREAVRWTEP